jgi:UDPglucose--hexose-1-phosphate uridylyltransferase
MYQIRQNIATKEWVVIATSRARRAQEFTQTKERLSGDRPEWDAACPFCPGNEEPAPIEQMRLPAEGPWQVRVVLNKYPALLPEGPRVRHFAGIYRWMSGVGGHEVVIEAPRHNWCMALGTVEEVTQTLTAFQMRGLCLAQDPRIEQIIWFENHGLEAGTSLDHPHAQIVALPVVPYHIRCRAEEARRYFDDTGVCVYCQMVEEELASGERVIAANRDFVAFIPFAAFSPFHTWIVPRRHNPDFLAASAEELSALADILRNVLRRLYFGLRDPDYNYVIRSAPLRDVGREYMHWYATIIPHVTKAAGFEMGSGMFINPALPEESAAFLRAVEVG